MTRCGREQGAARRHRRGRRRHERGRPGPRLRDATELDVVVLEQGPDVSYSACGIPYWVGGQVEDRDRLIARTPSEFAAQDIEVRTGTRAEGIDLDAGTMTAGGETLGYDHLVVATGGRPCARRSPAWTPTGCTGSTGSPTAPPSAPRWPPGRGGPSSSAVATSGWRWPTCCRARARRHRRPGRPAAHGPARRRHGRAGLHGHGRHGHRRPDRPAGARDRDGRRRRGGGGAHRRRPLPRRPRRPRARHGPGGGARPRRRAAARRDRRDRGRPHAAQPVPPRGVRGRRLLADVLPDHRRGDARRAGHARQQAGPGGRLGHRRPGGPVRRRPGDGADEGRRPGDRPHRPVHHAGRGRRLRLPHRDRSRGRRRPATSRARRGSP